MDLCATTHNGAAAGGVMLAADMAARWVETRTADGAGGTARGDRERENSHRTRINASEVSIDTKSTHTCDCKQPVALWHEQAAASRTAQNRCAGEIRLPRDTGKEIKHTRRQQQPNRRDRPIGSAEQAPGSAPDSKTGRVLPTCGS